jgi:hypothetical protein
MAKLHYANKLANLLCNITNELIGLWQDQRPTSCTCWALVLPKPMQQVGQQVGSVEFISQQAVQQVRVWCTRHELVDQQVDNLLANLFV